jgi:hypothetical protein
MSKPLSSAAISADCKAACDASQRPSRGVADCTRMFCCSLKGSAKVAGLSQRVLTESIRLDTTQCNFEWERALKRNAFTEKCQPFGTDKVNTLRLDLFY